MSAPLQQALEVHDSMPARGFMTRRQLTLAAAALLAVCWPFLPEFTVVVLSYIGL